MTEELLFFDTTKHLELYLDGTTNISREKYLALEQENAELKADNEKLKALCDTYKTCYQAKHSDIKCLFPKYKQTLQEIKAIVKNICDGCTSECDCDEDCNYFLITEALTKAESEV